MSFLETILARKRAEVAASQKSLPAATLHGSGLWEYPRRSLHSALAKSRPAVIAEVKKASPSKGVLRRDFDHVAIACSYEAAGASAVSVLTDELFFGGNLSHLSEIRQRISLPVLRKDFIIDPYQLVEARAAGADAVLLIAAALDAAALSGLLEAAHGLGLECLVEVHSAQEIMKILDLPVDMVGINNRDLSTFQTDIMNTLHLKPLLPPATLVISESGISKGSDLALLAMAGVHAVLIGEALVTSPDPGVALAALVREAQRGTQ